MIATWNARTPEYATRVVDTTCLLYDNWDHPMISALLDMAMSAVNNTALCHNGYSDPPNAFIPIL